MNTQKFNNGTEVTNWYCSHLATFPVVIEGGGAFEQPKTYPCIMVYDFIENFYEECADEHEDFMTLQEEGFCSDEIELFKYHYVYPTDFE